MTTAEIKTFNKILREKAAEYKNNPEEAKKFLVRAGISTKGGKYTKAYEHLCIQQDQA